MNWPAFGHCVVALECALVLLWLCAIGFKALRKLPAQILVAFSLLAVRTDIVAQKTNGVNNLPPQQMMQGGGSFQTGLTGLTGLSGIGSLVNLVNSVQTTSEDIARGWRIESVTTNDSFSYEMPTNAMLVGNWHVHGASSSFGNNRIDFGDWSFPLGTNDESFSSFWYFVDGRIRPAPRDAAHEICALGSPMSAVPGQSRLWTATGSEDSRILTWENFFLGGDTNAPVSAQIELFGTGDFVVRSNGVETVCRRVNPDDWDDDGIENDRDANPLFCDGDFFGPANILPEGANSNAYCTVSLVVYGPDALVAFQGDGPSSYPDPSFIARHGVTNDVFILIGKTYTVSSDWPVEIVGSSDPETEAWRMRGVAHQTHVRCPVSISAGDGNPFDMYVSPTDLGGAFSWIPTGCGCILSGSGTTFAWSCSTNCTCCGTSADGMYVYEGYCLPATSCLCGCYYDGEGSTVFENCTIPHAIVTPATMSTATTNTFINCILPNATITSAGSYCNILSNCLVKVAQGGPFDSGVITGNPKFTDAANGDYTLEANSQCRDKAFTLDWMTNGSTDLLGNPRLVDTRGVASSPEALPDLGCYEIQERKPSGLMLFVR